MPAYELRISPEPAASVSTAIERAIGHSLDAATEAPDSWSAAARHEAVDTGRATAAAAAERQRLEHSHA